MQRYAGRPFALVGVNADDSPEELRRWEQKAGLSWPSYWDGPGGPISAAWKVDRYPTLFLIDPEGVVRFKQVGAPPEGVLEAKIDELLRKAKR